MRTRFRTNTTESLVVCCATTVDGVRMWLTATYLFCSQYATAHVSLFTFYLSSLLGFVIVILAICCCSWSRCTFLLFFWSVAASLLRFQVYFVLVSCSRFGRFVFDGRKKLLHKYRKHTNLIIIFVKFAKDEEKIGCRKVPKKYRKRKSSAQHIGANKEAESFSPQRDG